MLDKYHKFLTVLLTLKDLHVYHIPLILSHLPNQCQLTLCPIEIVNLPYCCGDSVVFALYQEDTTYIFRQSTWWNDVKVDFSLAFKANNF